MSSANEAGGGLGELPEACVAVVLEHLDPPEICRLARLNRVFRAAAAADPVWNSKLPGNYSYLLDRAAAKEVACGEGTRKRKGSVCLGKRDVYAQLCRPNMFDGGSKVFWLEKWKGGVCMSIPSKALSITGIDDRRYWSHISTEESRFQTVAYLQQIWWFEVSGDVTFCFPEGVYSLFFRLQLGRSTKWLGRRVSSSEHIHGWDIKPVRFQLSTSDGQRATSECYLVNEPGTWTFHHVGDFAVEKSASPTKVKFSLTQIDCTHTKGGVCVDSVLICPAGCVPEKVYNMC